MISFETKTNKNRTIDRNGKQMNIISNNTTLPHRTTSGINQSVFFSFPPNLIILANIHQSPLTCSNRCVVR